MKAPSGMPFQCPGLLLWATLNNPRTTPPVLSNEVTKCGIIQQGKGKVDCGSKYAGTPMHRAIGDIRSGTGQHQLPTRVTPSTAIMLLLTNDSISQTHKLVPPGIRIRSGAEGRPPMEQLRALRLHAATFGDGNCLFCALSDQPHEIPAHHAQLRRNVCAWIEPPRAMCRSVTTCASLTHLGCMRQQGKYFYLFPHSLPLFSALFIL
jgi:hypothetical protein